MRRPTSVCVVASWPGIDSPPRDVRVTTVPADGARCILSVVHSMRITLVTALDSTGDVACLIVGAIGPAVAVLTVRGRSANRWLPVVVGGIAGFVINVVVL